MAESSNLAPTRVVRILHLEDSAIDADLICEFLEQTGAQCDIDRVWTREDFEKALGGEPYDLILADHQLPAFDGEQALAIARERSPTTPFVFVSGTLGEDVAVEALKRGATDYVVKQRLQRLPGVVERALREASERVERRRAEAALQALNETLESRIVEAIAEREAVLAKLAEVQKMETMGQLTGGVAHDFNNLLTPIIGNLDLLRRRCDGDERALRLIDGAMQGAERAQTLVQRLLAFARRQILEPQAVDVRALVAGLGDLIRRTVGPEIVVQTDADADLPPARVDPAQLELALLNLAVNARDAMPAGGRLRIDMDREAVGPDHPLQLRHGSYVRVTVSDDGSGMDAETLDQAIEPFFSTKEIGKGTGLGLSMVHGLAAQSGGALFLSSAPGEGTRAEIWLPQADTPPAADAAAGPSSAAGRESRTILVVDDEALVRMSTADMLEDLGYDVVEAGSGKAALDLLHGGAAPALVVTDYLMPGMNGADLAEAIRRDWPGMPILIVTGYANLAGHKMADLPLITKPFRQEEIAGQVRRLLERKVASTL